MLAPEELKKELEGFRVSGAIERLEQLLSRETSEVVEIGRAYLTGIKTVRDPDEATQRGRTQLKYAIDSLDDKDRRRLFHALFPPIANEVEASWLLDQALLNDYSSDQRDRLPFSVSRLHSSSRDGHPVVDRSTVCSARNLSIPSGWRLAPNLRDHFGNCALFKCLRSHRPTVSQGSLSPGDCTDASGTAFSDRSAHHAAGLYDDRNSCRNEFEANTSRLVSNISSK